MTFEDDRREIFRKDLIKILPINVEEDSEDERWGFGTKVTNDLRHNADSAAPDQNVHLSLIGPPTKMRPVVNSEAGILAGQRTFN